MVLDTSVIVAIFRNEAEKSAFIQKIIQSDHVVLSAANYLEACMVLAARKGESELWRFDEFLKEENISIEPVDRAQANVAREAWLAYGKGRHRARLNFGDCFAYALAKQRKEPLLFKGKDFSYTDVRRA
jgi:ribonuclease VapC